jgi:hypothetical protein
VALLNHGMKCDVLKFQTPYSLCASAPLRDINHPAIMQRRKSLFYEVEEKSPQNFISEIATIKMFT